jgi:hypothetical protein
MHVDDVVPTAPAVPPASSPSTPLRRPSAGTLLTLVNGAPVGPGDTAGYHPVGRKFSSTEGASVRTHGLNAVEPRNLRGLAWIVALPWRVIEVCGQERRHGERVLHSSALAA